MHRTRIKICGITRPEDVEAAAAAGADAVGFVCFAGSPRFVPADVLPRLLARVPPFVTPVLLFVNAVPAEIERRLVLAPQALLQFQGDESPALCAAAGRPYLRAIRMAARVDLLDCFRQFESALGLLADTPSTQFGGSGTTFDWSRLPPAAQRPRPLVLAGGLNHDNVGAAVQMVRPFAVDVSSGVETQPGIKSAVRIEQFIAAVRAADQTLHDR
jgi:phosphoribosylanthranilate isomerase